jgi:tight adherence protein C
MIPTIAIAEILVFCAVVLITVAAFRETTRALDQRRRLSESGIARPGLSGLPAGSLFARRVSDNAVFRWVQASSSISDSDERNKLRRALLLAGFESPNAPVVYVIARFSLAILLPGLFILWQASSTRPISGFGFILWPIILCVVGLFGPGRILSSLAGSRQVKLEGEFPDALDLMVVCVEAGLSLDAAFVRVGREIEESHPNISGEFARVSEQLRAGRARPDALRAMADRTGVEAIRSFVTLLIQTEMLGASIAQTLRTFSSEMRQTRFIKAEEKAMRIPVLMTIPLVSCILPVIVTALLLPAILGVIRVLMPILTAPR